MATVVGFAAGGVMTLAMASVADLVPPRERGRYQGYIQLTFLLASLAGPLLGGLFVDQLSWRLAFYVNVPLGAVALVLLSIHLDPPAKRRPAHVDYAGSALLAAAVVGLLLVLTIPPKRQESHRADRQRRHPGEREPEERRSRRDGLAHP